MRIIEIVILIVVTILPFLKRKILLHIAPKFLFIAIGLLIVLHLWIDGWRWQMTPAYSLVLLLVWRVHKADPVNPPKLSFVRIIGFIGILILLIPGWILPQILPVFSLPKPQGPYAVGSELIYHQTTLDETITKNANDKRELLYKIWYPSHQDVSSMRGEPYVDEGSRIGFATKYGLPPKALNYLDHVRTYSYPDIQIAEGSFPVLLFSHGYGSKATGYYALLSEVASQGYIIINMNHTYESLGVTYPDGRIASFDFSFQQEISSGSMEVVQPLIEAFKESS